MKWCTQCGKTITLGECVVVVYRGNYEPHNMQVAVDLTKPPQLYHAECWDRLIHIPKDFPKDIHKEVNSNEHYHKQREHRVREGAGA